MNLSTVRVGDIANQVRGVTYAKNDTADSPGADHLPLLRAGNISGDGLDFSNLVFVSTRQISPEQMIRSGDVIIAASSGSLATVGKSAQAVSDFNGGFGAFCKVLRPSDSVDARYFGHYFRTHYYRAKVSSLAAGANINNLRTEHLDGLQIPLPSLVEQKRIAQVLDQVDALRVKRRETITLLGNLTQSIFSDMFGDPFDNRCKYPSVPLIDWVNPQRPITYGILKPGEDQPGGVHYVRVVDMKNEGIDLHNIRRTTTEISNQYKRSRLEANDLLISIRGHVGRLAQVPPSLDGANITQDSARLATPEHSSRYVMEFLRSPSAQHWMERHTKGAAVKGINLGDLKSLEIPKPPPYLQKQFSAEASYVDRLKATHQSHLAKLDELFASLQYRAFRGELWDSPAT